MKKILIIFIFILISIFHVCFGNGNNIFWHNVHKQYSDENEFCWKFKCDIKLLNISCRDFEFIANKAFNSRKSNIQKVGSKNKDSWVVRISDGINPEYHLYQVEARSLDDIHGALNKIDSWRKK